MVSNIEQLSYYWFAILLSCLAQCLLKYFATLIELVVFLLLNFYEFFI